MKTDNPLLVSIAEAGFQLSLPKEEIGALIHDGELVAVRVKGQVFVIYESLTAFTRRARRKDSVIGIEPGRERETQNAT